MCKPEYALALPTFEVGFCTFKGAMVRLWPQGLPPVVRRFAEQDTVSFYLFRWIKSTLDTHGQRRFNLLLVHFILLATWWLIPNLISRFLIEPSQIIHWLLNCITHLVIFYTMCHSMLPLQNHIMTWHVYVIQKMYSLLLGGKSNPLIFRGLLW